MILLLTQLRARCVLYLLPLLAGGRAQILLPVLFLSLVGSAVPSRAGMRDELAAGFLQPPREARPWTLWQWMNGNISKGGITADLEAFERVGLGGAQSFHLDYGLPQGPIEFNSPEWREMYLFAAQEAARLGMQIGTHNGGGWSSSGGPWTLPENSMQVVVTREVRIKGPSRFSEILSVPDSYLPATYANSYRDIAVLAYLTPANESVTMGSASPKVTINMGKGAKPPVLLGDRLTSFVLPVPEDGSPRTVQIAFADPFTARQLILSPAKDEAGFSGVLEISDDGSVFTQVRTFQLAAKPHDQEYPYQQTIIFPQVTTRVFRIRVENATGKPTSIAELELSGRQTVENLPGKAFYQRNTISSKPANSDASAKEDGTVAIKDIIDLSDKMDRTGRLTWEAPPGNWTVVRIGHQSNGMVNHPAPIGGLGLESDKLSKEATDAHWSAMMAKLIEKFGPLTGKSFTKVEIDSWEVGTQNWTPKFREEFARRRGYDLTRFLPVFAGQTIESTDITERFLWDFRRTIADMFADNYAGRMRELANQHHMELAVENYGTGPFDDLQYGGMADIPMGVHWMHNGSPQSCTLIAASAAHTYGRKIVGSEAFTGGEGGGNRWDTDPYAMKRLGDLMYCSGVNRFMFHAATLQRFPDLLPGLTFGKVGTQFSRTATWWENAGAAWFSYMARCQWLLQQGLPVADVLVLVSEGMPLPTYGGVLFPDLPAGYDFDLCSADALLNRVTGRDGRLVLPDGMSYRLLMLPDETVMTPQVIRKVKELADAGVTIIGPKPVRSPSFTGYPRSDNEVRQLAGQLWNTSSNHRRGVSTQTSQAALKGLDLAPDFEVAGNRPQIAYKHRATSEAEIYFVSNQKYHADEIEATFRVSGKTPEIWNPETGTIEKASIFREVNGRTVVPLRLGPAGSVFVLFRAPVADHIVAAKSTPLQLIPRQTLEILKASYGHFDAQEHPRVADITGSKAAGYKRIFTPDRFVQRDPAPGVRKHMLAQYTVGGSFQSQAVPADGVLEMPQLPVRFKMVRILYGALTSAPDAGDEVVDVTATLNGLIEDGALTVTVNQDLAGQSAVPKKSRDLRVEYLYNGRWNIAIMPEGQRLQLPGDYEAEAGPTIYELRAEATGEVELIAWVPGSYEFTMASGKTVSTEVGKVAPPQGITGAWQLNFPPKRGAPSQVSLAGLTSWTESPDAGVKYFSGTATYAKELDIPVGMLGSGTALYLDLGEVRNIAQVILNGKNLGVLWKPPFRVEITGAARAGPNKLEIKVTNLWPNRLIGDENLPPDREWNARRNVEVWPQWLLDGKPSPTGRITFTTARHWRKDDVPFRSGLLGPVQLLSAEKRTLAGVINR